MRSAKLAAGFKLSREDGDRGASSMYKSRILLISSDHAIAKAGFEAATSAQRVIQLAKTSSDAFRALTGDVDDLAVIILDLDPVIHGLALLEALSMCRHVPPLLALTDLEECYMKPIVQQHGGTECIAKPVNAQELASAINKVCSSACYPSQCSCDRWGHPVRAPIDLPFVRRAGLENSWDREIGANIRETRGSASRFQTG